MTDILVTSTCQHIDTEPQRLVIEAKTQSLTVDLPTSITQVSEQITRIEVAQAQGSVSVTNAGPVGPPGASGATGAAQTAFHLAEGQPRRAITYDLGLPSAVVYADADDTPVYASAITYDAGLPVLVELERLSDNAVFTKAITYSAGLPVLVEWAA